MNGNLRKIVLVSRWTRILSWRPVSISQAPSCERTSSSKGATSIPERMSLKYFMGRSRFPPAISIIFFSAEFPRWYEHFARRLELPGSARAGRK